uniref:Uncharacterized protein n=1 Tax=Anguilla anguilla TaxID=7936 RepID=A0A0E9S718_ANGAN
MPDKVTIIWLKVLCCVLEGVTFWRHHWDTVPLSSFCLVLSVVF